MAATARMRSQLQPVDLRGITLFESNDGAHRSWIMFFPEGTYEHETYGDLDFNAKTLREMKANFDAGAREIDIAIDRDHKATDGDSTAMGWVEAMELRPALSDGTPAGLWGCIRWTDIGLHEIESGHYRYFSPEFKPEYTNQLTGRTFHNVVIGGALTNRPFLKAIPAIALAEGVSRTAWGSIDKSSLPDSAFLDPKNRRLPVYEGAGPKDANGRYTKRGKLNINGVEAALRAIHGARTGKPMSGLPAGIASKLQGWIDRYSSGGGDGEGAASKAASEGGRMTVLANGATDIAYVDTGDDIRLMDGNTGGSDQVSRKKPNVDDDMDVEEYADENDGEQYADGEGDQDGGDGDGFDKSSDTHGAMSTDGHAHGKYAEHSHDGDASHADAPLKRGGKGGKQMSESALARQLAEQTRKLDELTFKLYEAEAGKTLNALLPEGHKFSRVFAQQLKGWMLAEGYQLSEGKRNKVLDLIRMALSEKATVDMRKLGASFDQESRRTVRLGGDSAQHNVAEKGIGAASPDTELAIMERAEQIALAEGKIQPGETLTALKLDERTRIILRATKEAAQ